MSKHSSLVKQIEAFEKLAKFGNRSNFLESLAQDNQLVPAVKALYNSIINWVNTSGERQSDLPGKPEAGLPAGMRQPVQNLIALMKSNSYDLDNLPSLNQTVKNLLNVSNLGNLGAAAQSAWMKSVFPQASYVQDLASAQLTNLKNYRSENFPAMEDSPNQVVKLKEQVVPGNLKSQKLNQMSKSVSKALVNKLNSLSDGPERAAQLKEIDLGVKTLQNYFKRLQNSNVLNDYLARVDIVSALNKAYNALEPNDLKTVVTLSPDGAGGGVPESPDSKI